MYVWGQFIDHDIDRPIPNNQAINITIPNNDQDLTPGGTIALRVRPESSYWIAKLSQHQAN